jgi:hypothetical protein
MRFTGDPLLTDAYRDKAILPTLKRWVATELNGSVSGGKFHSGRHLIRP